MQFQKQFMNKRLSTYKLIILILFIAGVGLIAGGTWGLSYIKRIDKEYISTTAKIETIQKHTELRHGKRRTYNEVIVSYMVNGKVYTENLSSYSSSMKEGDCISLKYNPKQPSDIRSVEIENLLFWVMIFCGVTLLITDLFIPRLFRKLKNRIDTK
jgi:cytochrome b subunit of formate dehydrogenase